MSSIEELQKLSEREDHVEFKNAELENIINNEKTLLEVMVEKGFTTQERLKNVYFVNNLEEIEKIINAYIENNINL